MRDIIITNIEKGDYQNIVEINESVVQYMSQMNEKRLEELLGYSEYKKKIEFERKIIGFIFAMPENITYINENYKWFSERFKRFLYIDRVAIAPGYEGKGIGSKLYNDLIEYSIRNGKEIIACEINVVPPNDQSIMFHKKFGFEEIGQQ